MAYIDAEIEIPETSDGSIVFASEEALLEFVKFSIWKMYEKHKTESYKGKLFGLIPYSVKVEKLEPVLTKFLGPNPFE